MQAPIPVPADLPDLTALNLPEEDGIPMEHFLHRYQQELLLDCLTHYWRDREDYFAGANMFVYFSQQQAENIINGSTTEYRGPDFFVVLGVPYRPPRRIWVVWREGGRYPDVIVELLSPSTAENDRTVKKQIYEQVFATEEYFLFDFDTKELEGYELLLGEYRPKEPNPQGWLWSAKLGLWLGLWEGEYRGYREVWLRFYTPEGELVLTHAEAERLAREQAERTAEAERLAREQAERAAEAERLAREQAEAELQRLRAKLQERGISLEE